MAFTLDRTTASDRLGISTRTLDRYVKADRIRSKRIGKKLFLHEEDVEAIRTADITDPSDDYIVIHDDERDQTQDIITDTSMSIQNTTLDIVPEFARLYTRAQNAIKEKDEKIEDLSYRLGQAQTKLNHSVDTNEYRKATYLLETTRAQRNTEISTLQKHIQSLETNLKKRKKSFMILSIVFLILVIAFVLLVGVYLG